MKTAIIKLKMCISVIILIFSTQYTIAQVGINTTTPDASSVLDVTSSEKGMLAPRLTTIQKKAIASPANSLLVYDTTLKLFSYYDLPSASRVNLPAGRDNFKRIKASDNLTLLLAEELAAGGTFYKLNTGTLYEINGTINLDRSIELNNASLVGLDSGEDRLIRSTGDLFVGSTGGYIKLLTVSAPAGKIFNIVAVGSGVNSQNLIFRDVVVTGSNSVGSLENFGLIFSTIVQYLDNNNGIVYKNIGKLLLENQGWFANSRGTFEKLEGTFGALQKQGGFSDVNGTAIGLDVSSNPTFLVNAVMTNVSFNGVVTGSGAYVKGYTIGSYPGYNFNDVWYVDSPGIPRENDASATANLYKDQRLFVGTSAPVDNTRYKVNTFSTTAKNLFRFTSTTGRLTYKGKKQRTFQANATISYESAGSGTNSDYVFYFVIIRSDGSTILDLEETETLTDTKTNSFVSTIGVTGTITLSENESVELYLKRVSGPKTNIELVSYNLSLK